MCLIFFKKPYVVSGPCACKKKCKTRESLTDCLNEQDSMIEIDNDEENLNPLPNPSPNLIADNTSVSELQQRDGNTKK